MTVSHKPTAVSLLRLFYLISQLHLHRAVIFCGMCLWDGSSSLFVCCTICSDDRTLNNKTAVCLSMICGWVSGASFPDVWSKAINELIAVITTQSACVWMHVWACVRVRQTLQSSLFHVNSSICVDGRLYRAHGKHYGRPYRLISHVTRLQRETFDHNERYQECFTFNY